MCLWTVCTDLVVHEDVHDVQEDLGGPVLLRLVGQQDKLDAQKRDEDEGGSHSPHVQAGLGLVRHPQLSDEDPNDVQQEEEVHLEANRAGSSSSLLANCVSQPCGVSLGSGLTTRAAQMGPWMMYRKYVFEFPQHL